MDPREPYGDFFFTPRDRRGAWVRRHPVVTGFLVLIVLLVAGVWIAHDQAERALQRRIAAIRERGEPTTVQDMLSSQPRIPDDENMVIQLASAGRASINVPWDKEESIAISYLDNGRIPSTGRLPPTGERWSDAVLSASEAYLARANDALSDLHEALQLRRSFFTVHWKTPANNDPFRELSDLRQAAKLLVLECQIAAHQGRQEKFEQCIVDMVPMMRAFDGSTVLIGAYAQIFTTTLIQDTIERIINFIGLSDATLRELQAALHDAESYPDMKEAIFGERVKFLDTLQWQRSNRTTFRVMTNKGCQTHESRWRYIPVLPALDISAGLDQYEIILKSVGEIDVISIQEIKSLKDGVQRLPKYCLFSRVMLPGFSGHIMLWLRNVGSNRALRAAMGAERFRLAEGQWPSKLDDLVPKYLDAVPIDPIDGQPIRYAIIPEGIKTWTISDDDKSQDNGGDVKRLKRINWTTNKPKDYGWVILNPDMRNRPATSQPTTRPSE